MENIDSRMKGEYDISAYPKNLKDLETKVKFFEAKEELSDALKKKYEEAKRLVADLKATHGPAYAEAKASGAVKSLPKTVAKSVTPKASAAKSVSKANSAAAAAEKKAADLAKAAAKAMEDASAKRMKAEEAAKKAAEKVKKTSVNKTRKNEPSLYTNMSKITHSPSGRMYDRSKNTLKDIALNLEKAYIVAQRAYRNSTKKANRPVNKNSSAAPVASVVPMPPTALATVDEENSNSSLNTSVASTGTPLSGRNSNNNV